MLRAVIVVLFLAPAAFGARVLILNSYHQGYEWTDSQVQGILAAIHSDNREHETYVEYLDSRRSDKSLQNELAAIYARKYQSKPPDVIVATDDFAIHFLLDRSALFPGIPVIVSGANELSGSSVYLRQDTGREIAGILETLDILDTVGAALAIQPATRNVVTIGESDADDYGPALTKAFPNVSVSRLRTQKLSAAELQERLRALPPATIVLFSAFSCDGLDRQFTIQQSAQFVTRHSSAPVYGLNKHALGIGIVGGKLIDAFTHGHSAGEMAVAILSGSSVSDLGWQNSSNQFLFDDRQLRRWNLDRALLPSGSRIINEPRSLVREHWKLALAIMLCIAAQALIIAMLIVSRKRQRRLRMEAAASEARFRNLANAMPQMVWIADAGGTVHYFNERWQSYTGIDPLRADGRDWINSIHPDDREDSMQAWRASIGSCSIYEIGQRLRREDGTYRWHLTRAVPVRPNENFEWFGTSTDIDDQKKVEAALRAANRDLEQFAYSASHDLQEPLRMVSIYCQLLERRHRAELSNEGAIFLQYILDGAGRMNQLLQDLLAYTRMALSEEQPATECDTAVIFARVRDDLRARLAETGGSVVVTSPLPIVSAASVHVVQIFQNLLANALKYRSEAPPQIVVSVSSSGSWWRFAIKDNGIGIAPSYHEQIFGLFRRLHVQSEYPGTGVGLALCRKIVSRYGGEIWVESQEGAGTTFFFTLPAFVPRTYMNSQAPEKARDALVD